MPHRRLCRIYWWRSCCSFEKSNYFCL